MIILIPMGGHGSRFQEAGYTTSKASIPTTDRHTGKKLPMVICAMKDIPDIYNKNNKIICVDRDFHFYNGTEKLILEHFPNTIFIHDHVLLDQAYGCFLAREFLMKEEELFIGACDNSMAINIERFNAIKNNYDAIIISHTNDSNIAENPNAHSWLELIENGDVKSVSLKQTVSSTPMRDHATTGMFWFKSAKVFLSFLETMIWNKDTLNNKYYVDKVPQYYIDNNLRVGFFDVKYICYGTPKDYENYENTLKYWSEFLKKEEWA